MKQILVVAGLLALFPAVAATTPQHLAGEALISIPPGWRLATDSVNYPFQVVDDSLSAELLIFRSVLAEAGQVLNAEDLKGAVDEVVRDVILSMPAAELISNSGFSDSNSVSFAVEFYATDSVANDLYNRLHGYIYRHPDGYQILFALWAKAHSAAPPRLIGDLRAMQSGFSYYGPAEASIFPAGRPRTTTYFMLGIIVLLVVSLLMSVKRRLQKQARDDRTRQRSRIEV